MQNSEEGASAPVRQHHMIIVPSPPRTSSAVAAIGGDELQWAWTIPAPIALAWGDMVHLILSVPSALKILSGTGLESIKPTLLPAVLPSCSSHNAGFLC